jgi:hypothetical protein
MTGIFMSLWRVLPDRYPLGEDVDPYLAAEHGFGHLLDVGFIQPRAGQLYDWSSDELALSGLRALLDCETPTYAWDVADSTVWQYEPSLLARAARRIVPAPSGWSRAQPDRVRQMSAADGARSSRRGKP